MKYTVRQIRTIHSIFLNGVGDMGHTLPPPKQPNMVLTLVDGGVLVEYSKGQAFIPAANVIVADGLSEIIAEPKRAAGK